MKHSILRSFEGLVKGMDPTGEEPEQRHEEQPEKRGPPTPRERPKPRMVVGEGVFLGREWQVYSDGAFEGETVYGMEAFRDLEHFKSFVEVSPVLRAERSTAREPPQAPTEANSGAEIAPAARAADDVQAPSRKHDRSFDSESAESVPARPDGRLSRDLIIAGGLGIVLCAAWWLRFYVLADLHAELLRRGISGTAIRSTDLSVLNSLPCFLQNAESCLVMKSWGRFAGYLAYEPAFLWLSVCALGFGIWLVRMQRKRTTAS